MSENKMKEVVKLLNVEIGEIFKIKTRGSGKVIDNCFFTANELCINDADYPCPSVFACLLNGTYEIVKLPYKPQLGEDYWSLSLYQEYADVKVCKNKWQNDYIDIMLYRLNFCYATKEEAEANKSKFQEFLNSNTIIDWRKTNG